MRSMPEAEAEAEHTAPPAGDGLDPHAYFATLARYHVWATGLFLDRIDTLADDDYRRDVGLYFKSVHGSLNHLLVAEGLIWYPRFAEGVSNRRALNEEVEPDRGRVRERLLREAARWQPLIAGWPVARYGGTLDYANTRGEPQSLPFAPTLGHVFNHATHHRGQISAALTGLGCPAVETDLVAMLQAESRAAR